MRPQTLLTDLARMLYPHTCLGCGFELYEPAHRICHRCLDDLPRTRFDHAGDNPAAKIFYGRLELEKATSWLFYARNTLTQTLIHRLKYRGDTALGPYLGRMMAAELEKAGWWQDTDALVPLPLNRRKLRLRGYNQSLLLCRGLSEATGLPISEVAVMRTVHTATQTRRSRLQRWMNVAEVFDLDQGESLAGKHVVLVDDVITTGATMEACGQVLLCVPGLRLSVLSLALASRI